VDQERENVYSTNTFNLLR